MSEAGGLRDVADGLGLLLSTQSFMARALLGSLAAAVFAATAVKLGCVRSRRVRRGLVLAPLAAAAAAAVASVGDAFLPQLLVASSTGVGEPFEVFGQRYTVLHLQWLLLGYVAIASCLLLRRAVSHVAIHAYVRRALPCDDPAVTAVTRRIASKLGVTAPVVLLVANCPGGAFTSGVRHPVVGIDPDLVDSLDQRELEGLLAHEIAHIARHDVATNIVLGVIRDLTFFVAPLYWAARWLRREQEHAADDAASEATGKPAALASSILKVWQGASRRRVLTASMACATMVPAPLPVPAGMPSRILRQGGLRGPAKAIATRVVRLIEGEARPSTVRERVEMVGLALVLGALGAITVVLPASMAESSLLLGQWSRPEVANVESPAMATFRELARPAPNAFAVATAVASGARDDCSERLVVETTASWRTASSPTTASRTTGWPGSCVFVWQDGSQVLVNAPRAEPLWGVDSRTSRFGVYVVR